MFDFDDPKNWSALLIGLLLMALGVIPLLNTFKVITWGTFLHANWLISVFPYLLAVGGVYLLIEAFMEDDHWRLVSIVVALLVIAVGVLQILSVFKVIGLNLSFITPLVYNILFAIEGFFLVIASFVMF